MSFILVLTLLGCVYGCVIAAPTQGDFPIYKQDNLEGGHSSSGWYQHGAVASDTEQCSQVGRSILEKGGSAVDAGIAALFCNGVMDQPHMGLGGGSVMLIYERPRSGGPRELVAVDGDVRVPQWLEDFQMSDFIGRTENDILVPGEVAGYKWAWERYGRLPWADLVQPSIKLAQNGWNVTRIFAQVSQDEWEAKITSSDGLKFFRKLDTEQNKEVPYSEGDLMTDPSLANTLELISTEGGSTFYNGTLSSLLLQDMEEYGIPITRDDLQGFQVKKLETVKTSMKDGQYYLNSVSNPFYGSVLVFVVNIMESFNMTKAELRTENGITLFYHRFIEAWKFIQSIKTCIGDTFEGVDGCDRIQNEILTKEFAKEVAEKIHVNGVLSEDEYDLLSLESSPVEDHGTSHLSIIASDGSAFSATSTVSMSFGSNIKGTTTGIVFNNRMLSFNHNKDVKTAYDIVPGKVGYSCRSPVIVTDNKDNVVLVLGTSGGARIAHVSAMTLILHVIYDLDLQNAIDYPKVAQFGKVYSASEFMHEFNDEKILNNLRDLGQDLKKFDEGVFKKLYVGVSQGVSRKGCDHSRPTQPCIEAVSDFRKGGAPDGY